MPTDDERREVAARLRKAIGLTEFAEVLGFNWTDDSDWAWKDVSNLVADLIEPQPITGDTSDGYHTFDELYDHRAKLFSVIVRCFKDRAWKSKLHHDGTMYEGMFIVGIGTPDGQATYHYDVDPYWGIFDCEVLDRAPEWDGHTPRQAIDRIAALGPSCDRGPSGWASFDERLPEPGTPVLCKGKNGAYYVGKPVTYDGERTSQVWVPRGAEYRSPAAWRPVDFPSCDREALLALADEMDDACPESASVAIGYIDDYALRIREACGVER